MLKRLEKIEKRYLELEQQLAAPETASDLKKLQELAQERAGLEHLVSLYRRYENAADTLEKTKAMLRASPELFEQVKLVVIDEGHLLGDNKRNVGNEMFLFGSRSI